MLDQPPRPPGPPARCSSAAGGDVAAASALDDAVAGAGRLVLVAGEPGIGKSRLTEELATLAEARGARVLVGRCWEAGGAPAYWPWVQSLRALAMADGLTAPKIGAAELTELVPEFGERFATLPSQSPLASDGARFRLFQAVAELVRSTADRRPIVLVIDDLHAADAPSLLLLRFVARSLASMRVLLVCAYRDVDPVPGPALVDALAEVRARAHHHAREARDLSQADVARFVALTAAELASPRTIAALYAETDGNALFVGETVRLLAPRARPSSFPSRCRRPCAMSSPGASLALARTAARC